MSVLGNYLKSARVERGLSLREVERLTDGKVSNAHLSQIETGKVDGPSIVVLHRLANALHLDFVALAEIAVGTRIPEVKVCPTCGQPT